MTSQMALQFMILSVPFFAMFFGSVEIILIPLLGYLCFWLLRRKAALNYIEGQWYHKKNYARYMVKTFILDHRPGIYRDFVYDFWVKLKESPVRAFAYIYKNPLVEIIYGFPFLWVVIYYFYEQGFEGIEYSMMIAIFVSLILFILTSFRFTRFLGEPQRYVEFSIPVVTILFCLHSPDATKIVVAIISLFFIIVPNKLFSEKRDQALEDPDKDELFRILSKFWPENDVIFSSNDAQLLKVLSGYNYRICRPDIARKIENDMDFYNDFYGQNHSILSNNFIVASIKKYSIECIVINGDLPNAHEFESNSYIQVNQAGKYRLLKLIN